MASVNQLSALARQVRARILRSTTAAGSGHPTSSLSATDLMVALLFGGTFHADLTHPAQPNNDRLIFSKGHAAPLLYALYAAAGRVSDREFLTLRRFGSRLEGHPMPTFPYTEAPTGSLGQGLAVGLGMALAARFDRLSYRTFVLLGDSELAEGSNWEAIQLASHLRLANLTAIVDVNRLGQSGPTMLGHSLKAFAKRFEAFGWRALMIDGHDISAIQTALRRVVSERQRPVVILAKTIKGQGVSWLENKTGWHGRTLTASELDRALASLGPVNLHVVGRVARPRLGRPHRTAVKRAHQAHYRLGQLVAPRTGFGNALTRLASAYPRLVVLDAEVMNSTMTEGFADAYPARFVQNYIAEQTMAGVALGLATRGLLPVAATFAAFWTRAHDQLRMTQYAGQHMVCVGTHAGVAVGADGASQMGLEDVALFRTLHGAEVFSAADALAAERLTELALRGQGIAYLRLTRGAVPVVYPASTRFHSGGSQTLRRSLRDRATLVACGTTVHEALAAADILAQDGIRIRVIDAYSIKPIDAASLKRAARVTKHLLVVEDHVVEGGLADAVRTALGRDAGYVISLAVRKIPKSGPPDRLLAHQDIDRNAIVRAVRSVIR